MRTPLTYQQGGGGRTVAVPVCRRCGGANGCTAEGPGRSVDNGALAQHPAGRGRSEGRSGFLPRRCGSGLSISLPRRRAFLRVLLDRLIVTPRRLQSRQAARARRQRSGRGRWWPGRRRSPATRSPIVSPPARSDRTCRACAGLSRGRRPVCRPRRSLPGGGGSRSVRAVLGSGESRLLMRNRPSGALGAVRGSPARLGTRPPDWWRRHPGRLGGCPVRLLAGPSPGYPGGRAARPAWFLAAV